MRKVSPRAYTEIYFWGCNPSFVATDDGVVLVDTPQQPKDAVAWREAAQEHGSLRYLVNTEPHPDHISGNAYFPSVEVVGQVQLRDRYVQAVSQMAAPERLEMLKESDPDSVWLFNHPDYPPKPPSRTFTDDLRLTVGNRTFWCIHMPGHTKPQTSVYVPEEGVVFTGDNVFHKCKTFIQEADPWEWLAALDRIASLDAEVIVPGHGEPCSKDYLATQAEIIGNWLGVVEAFVDRGLSEDEALAQPLEVPRLDPYPIGQRLFRIDEQLNGWNVRNLYRQVARRRHNAAATEAGR
jgi:cyclase